MMTVLTDVLPPKARKYAYAGLGLGALVLGAYKASGGDWLEFAGLVLGSLGFGTAASNTPVEK
jgi:hypothetical protein